MIVDIIVILKLYLIFNSIDNMGVHIRYPCPNTDNLCYNTDTLYTTRLTIYIIYESIRQTIITLFIINFMNNLF